MNLKVVLLSVFLISGGFAGANEPSHGEAPEKKDEVRQETSEVLVEGAKVFQMGDSGSDVKIPGELWNLIQGNKPEQNLTFAPLKLRLKEKTSGVLIAPLIIIELPLGGGEVDLSKFVRNVQGTFTVFFEYEELRQTKIEQIFFVSRAKKRRLENEIWGAGCDKFMDIREYMNNEVLKKGIDVNTTSRRHLSVLGGSFVFSAKHQIAQVTFKDSTALDFFCEDAYSNPNEVRK